MKKQLFVLQDILGTNQKIAREIKSACEDRGVLLLNLMSLPGAGKTTLLEALAERLAGRYRMAVI
jgi:hydrogenase nickel incorporation protein HypB